MHLTLLWLLPFLSEEELGIAQGKNTLDMKNERERGRRGMKSRRKIDEGLIWLRKALSDATLISTTTLGSREESTVRDRNSSKS